MKKTIIILNLLILLSFGIKSQDVIFSQDVLKDTVKRNYGPNLKHFSHLYLGYGQIIGKTNNTEGEVIPCNNYNIEIGYKYKYKICNFYSVGTAFSYNIYSYSIKQTNDKKIPDRKTHKEETLRAYTLSLNVYNRFNFGKRGNYIGKFFDIGVNGDLCFSNRHLYKDDLGSGITSRTVVKGLKFYEPYNYGVYGNIGINRYVLTCKYRISELFKPKYDFQQMPPLTIGLQIGFH